MSFIQDHLDYVQFLMDDHTAAITAAQARIDAANAEIALRQQCQTELAPTMKQLKADRDAELAAQAAG